MATGGHLEFDFWHFYTKNLGITTNSCFMRKTGHHGSKKQNGKGGSSDVSMLTFVLLGLYIVQFDYFFIFQKNVKKSYLRLHVYFEYC